MGTYIFQPKNYVHSNYLTKLASLRNIVLIIQDALHLQKSEIISLFLKLEHYEFIFYSTFYFEKRTYIPVMARGPPSEPVSASINSVYPKNKKQSFIFSKKYFSFSRKWKNLFEPIYYISSGT